VGRNRIPFEEALAVIMGEVRKQPTERVGLLESVGRVLAEEISTDMDFPPFDKACMDGFACRREDLGNSLKIIETVAAGTLPTLPLGPGEATRIMTGAMIPKGSDCVFMVEYSETAGADTVRFNGNETADNIAPRGEDLTAGDAVLEIGTMLEARHVAVLASVGASRPLVATQPRIGVIATGDELVEPSQVPAAGQIRNSNSFQLMAQSSRAGVIPTYYGIAADTEATIEATLRRAMAENDVVLMSGGVSMGDFDLVPAVMKKCGFDIRFDQVAMKPGKPATFAIATEAVCFGMPGNPVSAFVVFEVFVRPYLMACMGRRDPAPKVAVTLSAPLERRRSERLEFVPVRLNEEGGAERVTYHGSAHFFALSQADGLLEVPVGVARIEAGTTVLARWL
jgi:molybdopterin molybdotransferase